MSKIEELLKQYPEEIQLNTIRGKLISGNIDWQSSPIIIKFESSDSGQILFSLDSRPIRIATEYNYQHVFNYEQNKGAFFNAIFWISNFKNDSLEIKYLICGNGQRFVGELEIGYGDNIITVYKTSKLDRLSEDLAKDFVLTTDKRDYLFIQTYPGETKRNFTIYGMKQRADIVISAEKKWVIQKIVHKPFPKNHNDFLELNVAEYPKVRFVEESFAKEAYETIQAEEEKGNTLIKLWERYSEYEYARAFALKENLGELRFSKISVYPNSITRIKITSLNENEKNVLVEKSDDIINSAFELHEQVVTKNTSEFQPVPVASENNSFERKRFLVKSINKDLTIDLYDELATLPEKGTLTISLTGDEIVKKRRARALKSLREDRRFITRNLLFAIEGVSGAMLDKKRKEKPITERTKKFLKDKFGINELTKNQREAVEIAINTPDIAIIQGPPGTGKSTIVAAICDRLIEIAEKSKTDKNIKLIMVSAFQNDTVEHIASKIFTLGLPTIKIGKETQSNIRAEDKLIEQLKLSIDNSLQTLAPNVRTRRISKELKQLHEIYLTEKDDAYLISSVNKLLSTTEVDNELFEAWRDITGESNYSKISNENTINMLKGLRTELESYNDDGFEKIQRLLKSDISFNEEERIILLDCPLENPDQLYLNKLRDVKAKYLEILYSQTNRLQSGDNLSIIEWLKFAIKYFLQKEESTYQNDDVFFTANLEAIRSELYGSVEYIRESIKYYGESLAATNQIAGSKEMSSYSSIENVILEEAARSNPLDLLIPMSKATERIIMVGDQNQLPHLLEDDIAEETSKSYIVSGKNIEVKKKLKESLFGVIFSNLKSASPKRVITLTEQFRMHPFIGDFISRVYYAGQLESSSSDQADKKRHRLQLSWAREKVAVFCEVETNCGPEQSGKSKCRTAESVRIIKLLDELNTDPQFSELSVGIITFYAKQAEEIFKEAVKKGYAERNPDGSFDITSEYKETPDGREKLRIGTVDSFQGKEFDVVILSTVRSNNIKREHDNFKKIFGFLTLENRLNVAFSRAQKLLIVAGDSKMFDDDYAKTYVEGLYEFYTSLSNDTKYGTRIR